ncbi:CoA-binding protein [Stackebrandtia soli]|uniref:CoA-binding protein n=1 Tax=Stackebrandtia soli TaxID=1892856 RepID=UPI0039EB5C76
MSTRQAPQSIWDSRSVAVIGASDRPSSTGGRVVRALLRHGFTGTVHPVHPTADTVAGQPATATVADVGSTVDLAMVLVPSESVRGAVVDCLDAGVSHVIVGASGFAETGERGASIEAAMAADARAAGARLWGPNTIGVADFATGLAATFSPALDATGLFADPGGLAVVSHSGGLGYGIAGLAAEAGLPVRWVATTGNEADVTAGEVIADLAERDDCRNVIAFLESPPDRASLDRIAASSTPVTVLRAARSRNGIAHSVTATRFAWADLTSEHRDAVQDTLTITDDLPGLLAGAALGEAAPPRVAVITTSGGSGILAADAIDVAPARLAPLTDLTRAELRSELPDYATVDNPLDVTATVMTDPTLFTESLAILAKDPTVDAILVCLCVLAEPQASVAAAAIGAVAKAGKAIAVSRSGATAHAPGFAALLADVGVTVHMEPSAAVHALVTGHRERKSS